MVIDLLTESALAIRRRKNDCGCQHNRPTAIRRLAGGIKMCLNADEVNPLCDECLTREKHLKDGEEFEPCEECKKHLKDFCWCCMCHRPGEVEDGICRNCRDI